MFLAHEAARALRYRRAAATAARRSRRPGQLGYEPFDPGGPGSDPGGGGDGWAGGRASVPPHVRAAPGYALRRAVSPSCYIHPIHSAVQWQREEAQAPLPDF